MTETPKKPSPFADRLKMAAANAAAALCIAAAAIFLHNNATAQNITPQQCTTKDPNGNPVGGAIAGQTQCSYPNGTFHTVPFGFVPHCNILAAQPNNCATAFQQMRANGCAVDLQTYRFRHWNSGLAGGQNYSCVCAADGSAPPCGKNAQLYAEIRKTSPSLVSIAALLRDGANPNGSALPNFPQPAPFFVAATLGHADVVRTLVENGADHNKKIVAPNGQTVDFIHFLGLKEKTAPSISWETTAQLLSTFGNAVETQGKTIAWNEPTGGFLLLERLRNRYFNNALAEDRHEHIQNMAHYAILRGATCDNPGNTHQICVGTQQWRCENDEARINPAARAGRADWSAENSQCAFHQNTTQTGRLFCSGDPAQTTHNQCDDIYPKMRETDCLANPVLIFAAGATLTADTNLNCACRDGGEPPFCASTHTGLLQIEIKKSNPSLLSVNLLIGRGAQVDPDEVAVPFLFVAASLGHSNIVRTLIENGANAARTIIQPEGTTVDIPHFLALKNGTAPSLTWAAAESVMSEFALAADASGQTLDWNSRVSGHPMLDHMRFRHDTESISEDDETKQPSILSMARIAIVRGAECGDPTLDHIICNGGHQWRCQTSGVNPAGGAWTPATDDDTAFCTLNSNNVLSDKNLPVACDPESDARTCDAIFAKMRELNCLDDPGGRYEYDAENNEFTCVCRSTAEPPLTSGCPSATDIALLAEVQKATITLSAVRALLNANPKPNLDLVVENTPILIIAATAGHAEIVSVLITAGANPFARNPSNDQIPHLLAANGVNIGEENPPIPWRQAASVIVHYGDAVSIAGKAASLDWNAGGANNFRVMNHLSFRYNSFDPTNSLLAARQRAMQDIGNYIYARGGRCAGQSGPVCTGTIPECPTEARAPSHRFSCRDCPGNRIRSLDGTQCHSNASDCGAHFVLGDGGYLDVSCQCEEGATESEGACGYPPSAAPTDLRVSLAGQQDAATLAVQWTPPDGAGLDISGYRYERELSNAPESPPQCERGDFSLPIRAAAFAAELRNNPAHSTFIGGGQNITLLIETAQALAAGEPNYFDTLEDQIRNGPTGLGSARVFASDFAELLVTIRNNLINAADIPQTVIPVDDPVVFARAFYDLLDAPMQALSATMDFQSQISNNSYGRCVRFKLAGENAAGTGPRAVSPPLYVQHPPNPPANIVAATIAGGRVSLSWTPPAVRRGAILGEYQILRQRTGSTAFAMAGRATVGAVFFLENAPPTGTRFRYKLRMDSSAGTVESGLSNAVGNCPEGLMAVGVTCGSAPGAVRNFRVEVVGVTVDTGNESAVISASWTPPNDGGLGVDKYDRRTNYSTTDAPSPPGCEGATLDAGGGWSSISTVTSARIIHGDFIFGKCFSYAIRAINAAGSGPTVRATIYVQQPPDPPSNIVAVTLSDGRASLSWSDPSVRRGAVLRGYDVFREVAGSSVFISVGSSTVGYYVGPGPRAGTRWRYRLRLRSSAGSVESGLSNGIGMCREGEVVVEEVCHSPPGAVRDLRAALIGDPPFLRLTVNWMPPASNALTLGGYTIYLEAGAPSSPPECEDDVFASSSFYEAGVEFAADESSADLTANPYGYCVRFYISAFNAAGSGPTVYSPTLYVQHPPQGVPGVVAATISENSVSVSWNAVGDNVVFRRGSILEGYEIWRAPGASKVFSIVGTSGVSVLSYVDGGLPRGNVYRYKVLARSSAGDGELSALASLPVTTAGMVRDWTGELVSLVALTSSVGTRIPNMNEVRRLLAGGADPDVMVPFRNTGASVALLIDMAQRGHANIVGMLVGEFLASPDAGRPGDGFQVPHMMARNLFNNRNQSVAGFPRLSSGDALAVLRAFGDGLERAGLGYDWTRARAAGGESIRGALGHLHTVYVGDGDADLSVLYEMSDYMRGKGAVCRPGMEWSGHVMCVGCGEGRFYPRGGFRCECDEGLAVGGSCLPRGDIGSSELWKDRLEELCSVVFGGEVEGVMGIEEKVCSGMDELDTFCVLGSAEAFPCEGLFKHVRDCNGLHNRVAYDMFYCGGVCGKGSVAVGGECSVE